MEDDLKVQCQVVLNFVQIYLLKFFSFVVQLESKHFETLETCQKLHQTSLLELSLSRGHSELLQFLGNH